jgi:predicted MPP superfamily phosphohydrolase
VNETPVYVNRGLGSLKLKARFLRRPELTLITLRSARKDRSALAPNPEQGG